MKNEILDLAIVGVGGIAHAHINNLKHLGGNRIVAVADISPDNRKRAAETLPGVRVYEDFGQMFEKERELDAVLLFTPPVVRGQVVKLAAPRKLPVLCEKPPARTNADAADIVRITRETGSFAGVGFMYRHLPAVDYLRTLLAGRPISFVQSVFACPAITIWHLPAWFKIKEKSGGHVLDQAVHVMDLIRYLAGDITQVFTVGTNVVVPKGPDMTIEDSSSTTMRFVSGASGTHAHSWAHSAFFGEVGLYGKDFRLTLMLDHRVVGYIGDEKIDKTFDGPPAGCSHHVYEMQAFLAAVRSGDFSLMRSPYADAAGSLATVIAMNESIDTGKPVAVGE